MDRKQLTDMIDLLHYLKYFGQSPKSKRVEFDEALIYSKMWPQAVDPDKIVTSPQDIIWRARSIILEMCGPLYGKNFLDFGCGTGECALEAAKTAKSVVAYDIKAPTVAATNLIATNDLTTVADNGPYDRILVYDVVDHILDFKQAVAACKFIKSVSTDQTIISMRCHPYTSIHGGHVYRELNKAYAHMFLSNQKIIELKGELCGRTTYPERHYDSMLTAAGLTVKAKNIITTKRDFIKTEPFTTLLSQRWEKSIPLEEMIATLEIEFIDFKLAK